MTPERAKELLPIVQAIADGKQVEWLNPKHLNTVWSRYAGGVRLDDDHILWRVKPEPREWWICLKCRNGIRESINNGICPWCHGTYTHVREVLP